MAILFPIQNNKYYMGRDGQIRFIIKFEECDVSQRSGLEIDQIVHYQDYHTGVVKQMMRRTLSKWAVREAGEKDLERAIKFKHWNSQ